MAVWKNDKGYEGCKTARFGDLAVVICPPEDGLEGWGYQVFDETDCNGRQIREGYGYASENSVICDVEDRMALGVF